MSPSAEHDWASPDVLDAVTLVQGLSPTEAAELLQVAPPAALLSFEQLDVRGPVRRDGRWMHQVQIDDLSGWLVLTAAAGPAGRELWPELSAGGALLRVSQTINADVEFRYARLGHEVRRCDPLLCPDEQWGQPLRCSLQVRAHRLGRPEPQAFGDGGDRFSGGLEQGACGADALGGEPLADGLVGLLLEPAGEGPYAEVGLASNRGERVMTAEVLRQGLAQLCERAASPPGGQLRQAAAHRAAVRTAAAAGWPAASAQDQAAAR